jgi:hypothetical protein
MHRSASLVSEVRLIRRHNQPESDEQAACFIKMSIHHFPHPPKRRRGYRPAIVAIVVLALVVVGIVLKNMREQQPASSVPEVSGGTGPAVPR